MAWSSESRHKRGYGKEWDKARRLALQRDNGLCQPCLAAGRVTRASQVDHIKPKAHGGTDELSNLQSICKDCHDIKTAEDEGRSLKPRITIGEDGWPAA